MGKMVEMPPQSAKNSHPESIIQIETTYHTVELIADNIREDIETDTVLSKLIYTLCR